MARKKARVLNKVSVKASRKDTRAQLIQAAKPLFATQGLSGTGIREIANKAGLNSSLVSYHFGGKAGLYRACIEDIAGQVLKMATQTLEPPRTKADFAAHLQFFIKQMIPLFLEDRNTGLILIREYDRLHSPASDVFQKSLLQVLKKIQTFFKAAQNLDHISRDQDPALLASLLFSCVIGQLRSDHLYRKMNRSSLAQPRFKQKVTRHIVELFMNS